MPRVNVYVSQRFLELVDKIAAKNQTSRSSLLTQIFMFGLHDYAELYALMARLTGEHIS